MPSEHTQHQSPEEQREAQELSLKRSQPPTEVPGYETHRFLGSGAYGEVWVGIDKNTGRQVAIKFFLHGRGVDWSLLSRETEKLVFLAADRYVVQLLDVGWDAEPPYYVMEYIEFGSLEQRLRERGPFDVHDAVELFRELATGLMHAHGRGVLHCDLKPANVLLDQDDRPRLADFGQSRLSHEQTPSLGTLFYMAPEQADLDAIPDARWDVYALGAILYRMLTGEAPFRTKQALDEMESCRDLEHRLKRYREVIRQSRLPAAHRKVPHVDNALADIIDRCLVVNPEHRFPNVQSVLSALHQRHISRQRFPLMVLGFLGPILLLIIMVLFGFQAHHVAMENSGKQVVKLAGQSNEVAARWVAQTAAYEIDRYFLAVERAAQSPQLQKQLLDIAGDAKLQERLDVLADPANNFVTNLPQRQEFMKHAGHLELERLVTPYISDPRKPNNAASWFVCDPQGTQLAAVFNDTSANLTEGKNFSWRTYYHGGADDLKSTEIVNGKSQVVYRRPTKHITATHLSAPFQSTATNRWKVAISTPIYEDNESANRLLGIIAMTIDIGDFRFLRSEDSNHSRFAALVYGVEGKQNGMFLHHPIFDTYRKSHAEESRLPDRFSNYRVDLQDHESETYADPFGADDDGKAYQRRYLMSQCPVRLARIDNSNVPDANGSAFQDTGLVVIVQEDVAPVVRPVEELGHRLLRFGMWAFVVMVIVVLALWYFVLRVIRTSQAQVKQPQMQSSQPTPVYDMTTLAAKRRR